MLHDLGDFARRRSPRAGDAELPGKPRVAQRQTERGQGEGDPPCVPAPHNQGTVVRTLLQGMGGRKHIFHFAKIQLFWMFSIPKMEQEQTSQDRFKCKSSGRRISSFQRC